MSSLYEPLRDRLLAVTAVTTLVGTRIYPNKLPQNRARDTGDNPTLPAVVYQQISDPEAVAGSLELFDARFQFGCWGHTYEEANAVADAVGGALHGWRKNSAGIVKARRVNRLDDYDPDIDSPRIIVDVLVRHVELS